MRNTTFTAEWEVQDTEYDAAVRVDEDRDEEERQREEAERALARPVQLPTRCRAGGANAAAS